MKRLLPLALLFICYAAFGQNVRFGPYSIPSVSSTSTPFLVANLPPNSPVLSVCNSPANAVPCTNYATTFMGTGAACPNGAQDTPDPNAETSACQSTGDAQGNVAWWAPAGTYDFTVCISNNCFLYTVSQGAGGGGGGGGVSNVVGTPLQIGVVNGSTVPVISIVPNPTLPGNVTVAGTLNVTGTSISLFSQTISSFTGVGSILAVAGSPFTSGLYVCNTAGTLTTSGCPTLTANAAGSTTEMQFRGAFGTLSADATNFFTPSSHTQTLQNLNVTGAQQTSGPYAMATAIPVNPCTVASFTSVFNPGGLVAGQTGLCINSDGFIAEAVNGGPPVDIPLTGTSSVATNPVGNQTVVQPGGTTLNVNSLNGTVYSVASYNWLQNPSGTLSVGANTVTLTPCPIGLTVNTPAGTQTYVYISAVGTAEAALITSTTCPQAGSSSGTITFTAANSHGAGFAVGSASQGVQEALNAAPYIPNYAGGDNEPGSVVIPPAQYTWRARVTVPSPFTTLDFSGSVITCTMADTCLFVGSAANPTLVWNVTIRKFTGQAACNNCNFPMIEDAGQGIHFIDIHTANPFPAGSATNGSSFGSLIQIDGDEAAIIDNLDPVQGRWSHCTTVFCSVAVKGAGLSGGNGSGIIFLKNSNLNLFCTANGVDNQNSNTMRISDSVIEAQAQFAVRATSVYANVPAVELDNVYGEVAGCAGTNPLGTGEAGLIVENGFATVRSSVGPLGSSPVFTNTGTTGSTQYDYYIVGKTTTGSLVSAPFLAGIALTNGTAGSITVLWPQFGNTGTVTYDVIRASGQANNPAPYTAICTGGSPTACGSVALAQAQGTVCTANVCSITDSVTANTSSYTVTSPPTYWPALTFWPGSVVYTTSSDQIGVGPIPSGVHFDRLGDNVANSGLNPVSQLVSSFGAVVPKFFSQQCNGIFGGLWVSCAETQNGIYPGATLLNAGGYNAADAAGQKGRLIFEEGLTGLVNGGHKITLVDSNPAKTLATDELRPAQDANDTYIGLDNTAQTASANAQLAFGAPVSISNYIGSNPDNASYLERLTATLKTFTVQLTTNQQIQSTLATGTPPFSISSQTRVGNLDTGGNPELRRCGTTSTCSWTQIFNGFVSAGGPIALSSGSLVVTGLHFANTNYICLANDNTTPGNGVSMVATTSNTATITGTGTDSISYACFGN